MFYYIKYYLFITYNLFFINLKNNILVDNLYFISIKTFNDIYK